MQSMSTDQPTSYYTNTPGAHPAPATVFYSNGIEHYPMPNSNTYAQPGHMTGQFYNGTVSGPYATAQLYSPPFMPSAYATNGPRAQNPSYLPIIRPPNENPTGSQGFIRQTYPSYPNSNLTHSFPPTPYYPYQVSGPYLTTNYPQQTTAPHMSNQVPPQYSTANNLQQTQSSQPHQTQTSQHSSNDPSHVHGTQLSQSKEKRPKKILSIVDPTSHKTIELETSKSSSHTNSQTTTKDDNQANDPKVANTSTDEPKKTQIRATFQKQVALLLAQPAQSEKNPHQASADDQTKEKQADIALSQVQNSALKPTNVPEQTQSCDPDDSVQNDNDEEKSNDSQSQNETHESMSEDTIENSANVLNNENKPDESESIPTSSNSEPIDCEPSSNNTISESTTAPKPAALSVRHSYTKEALLSKRSDPSSQIRPPDLKTINGVTDSPLLRPITPSIARGPNIPLEKPEFHNRSEKPYIPANRNKIDLQEKFVRDITAILNKVTPQTYDKLLKQLDEIELGSYERLDGMIKIIFSKAVDERAFCSLYAKLCQVFQKKQITVPDESGQRVTHSFRQLLLTRCQQEFENDYRQVIEYEKRKAEIEVMTDEKLQKEEAEKLEENLIKAKRKKLGNIFFIGELFKLNMLTETIMYDCIEYLLRDKADEESLECLCKLLNTIGKELDGKAADKKSANRKKLEKYYEELVNITQQRQTSARIRFMIQDVMDFRKAGWVARRAEAKPTTIDEIHEQARIKREQEEMDQQREKASRREANRNSNNPQQYTGSRGSGMKQQANRTDDEQSGNRFNVNSVRQLQSNDKRNQGPLSLNLAPQGAWSKGSAVDKKTENDRSNAARTGKPPTAPSSQQSRSKTGPSNGPTGYVLQSQSSREFTRENSTESSRRPSNSGVTSPTNVSITNSREGSRNVSREQSREKNANTTVSTNVTSALTNNTDLSKVPFDEDKTIGHVHSLIEEYTENYSDDDERPVLEALEDVIEFCTTNTTQQALIVRELFTNVLEAKPRARKAIGHLLDIVLHKNIIINDAFLSGFKMVIDLVPDFAVDIPLIWQYIGEILGAFIGGPSPNMSLLKPILQIVPSEKSQQLFKYIIRYAIELSSKSRIQKFWQLSGFSLNDLFKADSIDSSFADEFSWLSETITTPPPTTTTTTTTTTTLATTIPKETTGPRADVHLVKLFKSVNDQITKVPDAEIISYIKQNMNPSDKYYIRNIVLSYLEACLINREPQKKIQEDIAKTRMNVLKEIIGHGPESEIQAVYAIQNFVHKLEHPPKMAQLLFDIFYDEECVSEDAFFEWLRRPDPSETEGHSIVEMSTKDFFTWLQQAETEQEEGEEDS